MNYTPTRADGLLHGLNASTSVIDGNHYVLRSSLLPSRTLVFISLLLAALMMQGSLLAQTNAFPTTGNVGVGTMTPAFRVEIICPDNDGGTGATRLRIGNIGSTGVNAPGSLPAIEILGARGDGNGSFEGRLAMGTRRTDGNALSNQTLGAVLFGGQFGTNPAYQANQILYPASIQGIAEGAFVNANTMPTGIAFLTGSTGNDVGAGNFSYGTERMRITNTGNIGIGLNNPWAKLQVWGGDFAITGSDFNGTAIVSSHGGVAYFGNDGVSNALGITTSGNVLIGQSTQVNSTYKLDVAGNVRANKLVSCYSLSSLADVGDYIRQNHHLPGVDPAAVMQKDGMDVGENQTRLLQKIEELTLYIIEQNKCLRSQDAELEKERGQLKELGGQLEEQGRVLKEQGGQLEEQGRNLKEQQQKFDRMERWMSGK
jgi:hypothetical protein